MNVSDTHFPPDMSVVKSEAPNTSKVADLSLFHEGWHCLKFQEGFKAAKAPWNPRLPSYVDVQPHTSGFVESLKAKGECRVGRSLSIGEDG